MLSPPRPPETRLLSFDSPESRSGASFPQPHIPHTNFSSLEKPRGGKRRGKTWLTRSSVGNLSSPCCSATSENDRGVEGEIEPRVEDREKLNNKIRNLEAALHKLHTHRHTHRQGQGKPLFSSVCYRARMEILTLFPKNRASFVV